jgi:hypothetical protein
VTDISHPLAHMHGSGLLEIDFETNVLSEVWLEAVAEKLDINLADVHATAQQRIAEAKARQEQALENNAKANSAG